MQVLRKGDDDRPRRAAAQARLDPVHAQRHGARAAARSACAARRSRSSPPTPRPPTARRCSATRSSACSTSTRSPASSSRTTSSTSRIWPATHYNVKEGTIEARGRGDRARAQRALRRARGRGQAARVPPPAPAHAVRHGDAARDGLLQRHRELLAHPRRPRSPGDRPYCLLDYFPDDFVCFIDESHQTVPQIGGMYEGDRSRKQTLVDYGFRLPSALDNRPQTFDEFLVDHAADGVRLGHARASTSARTRRASSSRSCARPASSTRHVEVRETRNQIDDLMNEVRMRVDRDERVLVTTLTKKMSEDLTDYLLEMGFKVRYLHSEVDTLERIQIIRDLRLGEYDVLVGVNLLREGLDLPEVSLVAILDADKEGFLRGETSLIQTIGRAARNVEGTVLMYADKETAAMRAAIDETDRRRAIQLAYNEEHGITAATIVKGISDIAEFLQAEGKTPKGRRRTERKRAKAEDMSLPRDRADDRRARGGDARRGRRPALRVRRAAARRDPRAAPRAQASSRRRRGAGRERVSRGADPEPRRCSPGTPPSGATCRGGARATRTRSSSPRSCSSRRRSRGSSRATRRGSSAGRPPPRSPRRRAPTCSRAWVGLGYNRRALRAAGGRARRRARRLAATTCASCRASGPYTAAAVGSFAFGRAGARRSTRTSRAVLGRASGRRREPPPRAAARRLQPGDDGARRDGLHAPARRAATRARSRRAARRAGGRSPRRRARRRRASASRTPTAASAGRVVAALAAGRRRCRRHRAGRGWQRALDGAGSATASSSGRRPVRPPAAEASPSDPLGIPGGASLALDRQTSRSATSPSAAAATSPRPSTPICADSPTRSTSCAGPQRGRATALARPPPSEQVRAIVEAAETQRRRHRARRPRTRPRDPHDAPRRRRADARRGRRPGAQHVGKVREATQPMLQRVDAMEGELGALVESLRTGANRLTADLALLEGNMGDLLRRRPGGRTRRRAPPASRPRPASRARARPRRAREPSDAARPPRRDGRRAALRPSASRRRRAGERRRRGRPPDRAQHGAQRHAARGDRPLPGRELRPRRPRRRCSTRSTPRRL